MRKIGFVLLLLIGCNTAFSQGFYNYVVKVNAFGEAYSTVKLRTRISIDEENGIITLNRGRNVKTDTIYVDMVYARGGEGIPVKFTEEMYGYEALYICEKPDKPNEPFVFVFRTVTDKEGQAIKGRIAWIEKKDGTRTSFLSD